MEVVATVDLTDGTANPSLDMSAASGGGGPNDHFEDTDGDDIPLHWIRIGVSGGFAAGIVANTGLQSSGGDTSDSFRPYVKLAEIAAAKGITLHPLDIWELVAIKSAVNPDTNNEYMGLGWDTDDTADTEGNDRGGLYADGGIVHGGGTVKLYLGASQFDTNTGVRRLSSLVHPLGNTQLIGFATAVGTECQMFTAYGSVNDSTDWDPRFQAVTIDPAKYRGFKLFASGGFVATWTSLIIRRRSWLSGG